MSDHAHDSHTGPIKTPAQLLWTSFFSFVAPVFIIIGLVYYVTSDNKPAAGAVDPELATAQRIQKIGTVELRDANRPLASGEEVYKAQCSACHATGAAGAPKFGDAAAWGPRAKGGIDALVKSATAGTAKGMPPKGGRNDLNAAQLRAVIEYMMSGGKGTAAVAAKPAAWPPTRRRRRIFDWSARDSTSAAASAARSSCTAKRRRWCLPASTSSGPSSGRPTAANRS